MMATASASRTPAGAGRGSCAVSRQLRCCHARASARAAGSGAANVGVPAAAAGSPMRTGTIGMPPGGSAARPESSPGTSSPIFAIGRTWIASSASISPLPASCRTAAS